MNMSLFNPLACRFSLRWLTLAVAALLISTLGLSPWSIAAARDVPAPSDGQAGGDLTFFVVSDTHYGLSPRGDETVPLLVEKMNALPGTKYPQEDRRGQGRRFPAACCTSATSPTTPRRSSGSCSSATTG